MWQLKPVNYTNIGFAIHNDYRTAVFLYRGLLCLPASY